MEIKGSQYFTIFENVTFSEKERLIKDFSHKKYRVVRNANGTFTIRFEEKQIPE